MWTDFGAFNVSAKIFKKKTWEKREKMDIFVAYACAFDCVGPGPLV